MSDSKQTDQRIAVVGGGVAGLTAAWLLARAYDVTLFERNDYPGGHTRTLRVESGPDAGTAIDTGFIVMNHRNYPLFSRMLAQLDVELEDSCMSFGFHCKETGYAYAGTGLNGLFAQRSLFFSPRHWSLIRDVFRFGRQATVDLEAGRCDDMTLGEYLQQNHYATDFEARYLLAMGAAIWSSPPRQMKAFPARAYFHFLRNHGLLTLRNRPQWRVVKGGSRTYVDQMTASMRGNVRLSQGVLAISRFEGGVNVTTRDGQTETFDHVVIAAHADEALKMLDDPSEHEQSSLGTWVYQANRVVLHTSAEVMPENRKAWASWNFEREPGSQTDQPVNVTYHMNRLQNLTTHDDYFVTLNRNTPIPEHTILNETVLHHPLYSMESLASQVPLRERNGNRNTWFCGSYFGYGFHEDAVQSAVEIASQLGVEL